MQVANIASMKASAEARLLYVELGRAGALLRGQLWPRSANLQLSGPGFVSTAGLSEQQVTDVIGGSWRRATASLSFSEYGRTLDSVQYSIAARHRYRSVALRCAQAGDVGDIVALLPAERGVISNADIVPISAGSCGVAVNNTPSLLEALLRGSIYVEAELYDPVGVRLRGQFPRP